MKDVVLTGGTGRSGSTIVGHLLDHHPAFVLSRPMEVRFLTGNDGVADALRLGLKKPGSKKAHAAAELAVDRLLHRWYFRAENVGLHTALAQEDLERLTYEYLARFDEQPREAALALTNGILTAIAATLRPGRFVDTTPANARKADLVEPIYPDSKVIIVIRDGRDVAASFTRQSFGPDDVFTALDQWGKRMLKSHQAALASNPARIHVMDLADLVRNDRMGTLHELMAFLEVGATPEMITWFDEQMSANSAHIGRWRSDFDAETVQCIDEEYQQIVEHLRSQGVRIPS